MKTWNKIPLFRLLIPLLFGIVFSFYIQLPILILLELVAFLFFLLFLFIFYKNYFTVYSRRWVFGAVINLLILVFGMLITQQNKPSSLHLHFNKLDDIEHNINFFIVNNFKINKKVYVCYMRNF